MGNNNLAVWNKGEETAEEYVARRLTSDAQGTMIDLAALRSVLGAADRDAAPREGDLELLMDANDLMEDAACILWFMGDGDADVSTREMYEVAGRLESFWNRINAAFPQIAWTKKQERYAAREAARGEGES